MQPPDQQSSERQRFTSLVELPNHRARFAGVVLVGLLAAFALTTTVVPPLSTERSSVAAPSPAEQLRLGYFANVTHAPALIADQRGFLESALGEDSTALETQIFNAGPAAIEALNSGALDAAYLGPTPALNSYLSSGGTSLKVVAGVTSGGASLVVSADITSADQLTGTELATPQFGGTQDVALRHFLLERGIQDSVTVTPSSNGTVPQLFAREAIDGAWLPEPHASLLVEQYGARRLLDEAQLWPDGKFPTTVLVVNQDFLEEHPQTVKALVAANSEAIQWLNSAESAERLTAVQEALTELNGSSLPDKVIGAALGEVSFDEEPLESTFPTLMEHIEAVGLGDSGDLSKIVDDQWIGTD